MEIRDYFDLCYEVVVTLFLAPQSRGGDETLGVRPCHGVLFFKLEMGLK